MVAVRAGIQRGAIETRQKVRSIGEIWGEVWPWVIAVFVMFTLRGNTVSGTDISVGLLAIPGILGMAVLYTGMMGLSLELVTDKGDGTLLRMKAVPNGMIGYLTGKFLGRAELTVVSLLIVAIPAAFLFNGLQLQSVTAWGRMLWVLLLGLLAVLPLGAIIGSLFDTMQSLGMLTLLIMGLVVLSGIFYPITSFPGWLQVIGQIFPMYWLGLGMRSALLPDSTLAAEIGQSWRTVETVTALGVWAVIGLVVAPVVLRRMTRKATGASIAPVSEGVRQAA